jgi:hypothetical protein
MERKEMILNRLKSLRDIDRVKVNVGKGNSTIYIKFETEKSLDFKFIWQEDHFIGYFLDSTGTQSQAVISLWTRLDAVHFVTAYSLLIDLRSMRPSPL